MKSFSPKKKDKTETEAQSWRDNQYLIKAVEQYYLVELLIIQCKGQTFFLDKFAAVLYTSQFSSSSNDLEY